MAQAPAIDPPPSESEVWAKKWNRYFKQMTEEEKIRAFYHHFNPSNEAHTSELLASAHIANPKALNQVLR